MDVLAARVKMEALALTGSTDILANALKVTEVHFANLVKLPFSWSYLSLFFLYKRVVKMCYAT